MAAHHLYCYTFHPNPEVEDESQMLGKAIRVDNMPDDWDDISFEWRLMVKAIHNYDPSVPLEKISCEVVYQ